MRKERPDDKEAIMIAYKNYRTQNIRFMRCVVLARTMDIKLVEKASKMHFYTEVSDALTYEINELESQWQETQADVVAIMERIKNRELVKQEKFQKVERHLEKKIRKMERILRRNHKIIP